MWSVLLALLTAGVASVLLIVNTVDILPTPFGIPVPDTLLMVFVCLLDAVVRLYVLPTRMK